MKRKEKSVMKTEENKKVETLLERYENSSWTGAEVQWIRKKEEE